MELNVPKIKRALLDQGLFNEREINQNVST